MSLYETIKNGIRQKEQLLKRFRERLCKLYDQEEYELFFADKSGIRSSKIQENDYLIKNFPAPVALEIKELIGMYLKLRQNHSELVIYKEIIETEWLNEITEK